MLDVVATLLSLHNDLCDRVLLYICPNKNINPLNSTVGAI